MTSQRQLSWVPSEKSEVGIRSRFQTETAHRTMVRTAIKERAGRQVTVLSSSLGLELTARHRPDFREEHKNGSEKHGNKPTI